MLTLTGMLSSVDEEKNFARRGLLTRDVSRQYGSDQQAKYQIKVLGTLNESWSDWFNGMTITHEDGVTVLVGTVVDQSALHGILARIRDLNLILISVIQVEMNSNIDYL